MSGRTSVVGNQNGQASQLRSRSRTRVKGYGYATCRALGHAWDQIPTMRRPSWGRLLTFRCVRCAGVREDTYDANYRLSVRSYRMPDGYKTDKRKRSEWVELFAGTLKKDEVLEGATMTRPKKVARA